MKPRTPDSAPSPPEGGLLPQRTGRNQGRYQGPGIDIGAELAALVGVARRRGWQWEWREAAPGWPLLFLRRPAAGGTTARRLYLSAGIHGDEPAGPLALRRLVEGDLLPADAAVWLCPCLNPEGCARNTRENGAGLDLNRDYRHPRSAEVRTHLGWLHEQPGFDLTLLLHEDWEAGGFYLYALDPAGDGASLAEPMLAEVQQICPLETAPEVDGRPLDGPGIIRPSIDPETRPDWPEALWLLQHKTSRSYTLEAPSDFDLEVRVEALRTAVLRAVGGGGRGQDWGGRARRAAS